MKLGAQSFVLVISCILYVEVHAGEIIETYGTRQPYTVVRNSNGACVAVREIWHELDSGRSVKAAFAIGFTIIEGQSYTLTSIQSKNFEMPKGTADVATVEVDNNPFDVVVIAETSNMFSAIGDPELLYRLFKGYTAEFILPSRSYEVPLTGTFSTLPLLESCFDDLVARGGVYDKENPLKGKENPLQ